VAMRSPSAIRIAPVARSSPALIRGRVSTVWTREIPTAAKNAISPQPIPSEITPSAINRCVNSAELSSFTP
jgi:hypothetical protein